MNGYRTVSAPATLPKRPARLLFSAYLLIFMFVPLASCTDPESPDDEADPAGVSGYFRSGFLDITQQDDGLLIIGFLDATDVSVEREGYLNGTQQELYSEDGIVLTLTADDLVQLERPYTDDHDREGTETYIVRSDKTAARMMRTTPVYDWNFYFADSGNAEIVYTARLAEISGDLYAEFLDTDDSVFDWQVVTVEYNYDTSLVLEFSNPHGSGASEMTVYQPVVYEGVAATLANAGDEGRMTVYERTDGNYIVDYFDQNEALLLHRIAGILPLDNTLYGDGETVIVLKPTGEVFLTQTGTQVTHTWVVNPEGMVLEHENIETINDYFMHFVGLESGNLDYTAYLRESGGEWYADFYSPVNEQIPVNVVTDLDGNIGYWFDFDNTAGCGTGCFWTDPSGTIASTTYTH
ncbi:MAG: hypothetical protein JW874_11050 [Spirochaetales bacterium]|nr:hypothetical protein [Spirochaetales bacterium]